jgi:hypothetical protein
VKTYVALHFSDAGHQPGRPVSVPAAYPGAGACLAERDPAPIYRMPLIGSVVAALTGRELQVNQGERLFLHTGDQALIVLFQFPEDEGRPGYRRGSGAAQARPLCEVDLRDHMRFGLLQKFAKLDGYTKSITQWDSAFRADGRRRFLVHDAVLGAFGTYQYARCDLQESLAWFDEGGFVSQLRFDGTCKALELLTDQDISLWESHSRASFRLAPGDQALAAYFHHPGGYRPSPFEPYTGPLSLEYARAHTTMGLLTRLSNEFVEANARAFPSAVGVPGGEVRVR